MPRHHFLFVIEQGLGHTVHGMNLKAVLSQHPDIEATILPIRPGATPHVTPLPLTNNWSAQSSWAARSAIRNHVKTKRVDAIFIHTQVAALLSTAFMRQFPTVISLDATPSDFDTVAAPYGHTRHGSLVENAKQRITQRALAAASVVVTWSAWAARSVVRDYGVPPDRVKSIYPGVDVNRFTFTDRSDRTGPVQVLFVGGDFHRKGGDDLIRAASSLSGLVELDLVTSNFTGHTLQNPQIRLHHAVAPNSQELLSLYSRADIFALPTHGDCTPLAIAEAMASGLPIVATAVGSIPDMLRHAQNGLLIPPSSPDQLAAAIRTLASNRLLLSSMGKVSRALAEEEHNMYANWGAVFATMRRLTHDDGIKAAL